VISIVLSNRSGSKAKMRPLDLFPWKTIEPLGPSRGDDDLGLVLDAFFSAFFPN
jgi:hypothetical protein